MTKESAPRQRLILARLCEQPISAVIYRSLFPVQREGRAEIMRQIAADSEIQRLTIESAIGQDAHDERALQDAVHRLGRHDDFHYEHREPRHEPLLWAADAIVFAYAAGGDLRRRCRPLVTGINTVQPPHA